METDFLKNPTESALSKVIEKIGVLPTVAANFIPQQAPSSNLAPASDARQIWKAFDGWSKLTVPSDFSHIKELLGEDVYPNTMYGWKYLPFPEYPLKSKIERNISLPDEWSPERDYHHAWYVIQTELKNNNNEKIFIRFDIVGHACFVFINNKNAGAHIGGYTPFEIDITAHVKSEKNIIAILVQDDTAVLNLKENRSVAQLDGGRGPHNAYHAGIRGGVYLEKRHTSFIEKIRIKTSTRKNQLNIKAFISSSVNFEIEHTVYKWPVGKNPVLSLPAEKFDNLHDNVYEKNIEWHDAERWSIDNPNLYILRTIIKTDYGSESIDTRFGFREFWIEGRNFMLNGIPVRLFGDADKTCELLSIVPDKSIGYTKEVLRFYRDNFNYKSFRLHGVLFPQWVILAADELGVMIVNQSGLRNSDRCRCTNGGEKFLENIEKEFSEWYWRDVNSPSVVIWDVENELIRGNREPELYEWVMKLDSFIKKHDPEAIIEHSGAAWYYPEQDIIHIHMHEQYNRIMRSWLESENKPLLMGEFWMGGCGETRLPTSYEYSDRQDWHFEEARYYRERILEMRYFGASGIMPHRMTRWPVAEKPKPLLSQADAIKNPLPEYSWRFETFKGYAGRGLSPIIVFIWPRSASVVAGVEFEREVVVCNDLMENKKLRVICSYGSEERSFNLELQAAEQKKIPVSFMPLSAISEINVEVRDSKGNIIENDSICVNSIPGAKVTAPQLKRRIVVVPRIDSLTEIAFAALGISYEVANSLPEDAGKTLVIVPHETKKDELGKTPLKTANYLAAGGRLLVLKQSEQPLWDITRLPVASAVRTSVPVFTGAGWDETNKDLIYSREIPLYACEHPVFDSLNACDFKEWNQIDGRLSDDTYLRPHVMNIPAGAEYRILAGATRRENCSLVEFRRGSGTGLLCQISILKMHSHPAAKTLFYNIIKYLDGKAWQADFEKVGIVGDITIAEIAGLSENNFVKVNSVGETPELILAGDNADVCLLDELAKSGCRVVVLSLKTAARIAGYKVTDKKDFYCSASRKGIKDDPLFWGVSSASFLPLEDTPVRSALEEYPEDAEILMNGHCLGHSPFENDWSIDIGFYGLETRDKFLPIAAMQKKGRGDLIVTSFEVTDNNSELQRQLFTTLLANSGVKIPYKAIGIKTFTVKKTIPLNFDGCLDDWVNDMDDINLSEYSHADPVVLCSSDLVAGNIENDLDFSAIIYFLYDVVNLYVGGIIFSKFGAEFLKIELAEKNITIDFTSFEIRANNSLLHSDFVTGFQKACEITDTRLLNLFEIHRQTGKAELQDNTKGLTFESSVPWKNLNYDNLPEKMPVLIRLSRSGGDVLQIPEENNGETEGYTLLLQ